ncbi:unnamed protein product [Bursaphelenchus okinawaensis]|uniref:Uncharacterized protein n=1 Tax=Bursaphelenchus okinawaensis TaxID=465554 RepID=A0A811LLK4_9BILA|nr:unnamed protein product [Bursaphelenchus okinawaensis]CAG9124669.1 unnamed protein product [Bursaphelenchus okinawaensis]
MHDIRLCFLAVTITFYLLLFSAFAFYCCRKKRRNSNQRRPRSNWEFGNDSHPDYRNQTGQMDDLVSVRSDGQVGTGQTVTTQSNAQPPAPGQIPLPIGGQAAFMRNNRSAAPFMRHGRMHNSYNNTSGYGNQARLISDTDTVKHQIPHITTQEIPDANGSQPSSPPPNTTTPLTPAVTSTVTTTTTPTARALHHRTTAASLELNGHGYRHGTAATDM